MEYLTELNASIDSIGLDYSELFLSTHGQIPIIFIREIPIMWESCGVMFNGLLLYYLVRAKRYRSPVFMLILNLSVVDLLVCMCGVCFASFLWPVYILPKSTWMVCKLVFYTYAVATSTSQYYLVVFASMRFYQLTFPLKARVRITSSFIRNICLLIMSLSVVAWSPFLSSFDVIDVIYQGQNAAVCEYTGQFLTVRNYAFLIVNATIPGVMILVLNLLKYIRVSNAKSSIYVQQQRQERKNTEVRAMIIVIAVVYITWIPANIYPLFYKYLPNHFPYQDKLYLILGYFNVSNSSINPLIYCFAAKSIRNDVVRFIREGMRFNRR